MFNVDDLRMSAVEITAVRCEEGRGLVVHSLLNPPLRLHFASEQEVEDWAGHLIQAARASRHCTGVFARASWTFSNMGDPYVTESQQEQLESTSSSYGRLSFFKFNHDRSNLRFAM